MTKNKNFILVIFLLVGIITIYYGVSTLSIFQGTSSKLVSLAGITVIGQDTVNIGMSNVNTVYSMVNSAGACTYNSPYIYFPTSWAVGNFIPDYWVDKNLLRCKNNVDLGCIGGTPKGTIDPISGCPLYTVLYPANQIWAYEKCPLGPCAAGSAYGNCGDWGSISQVGTGTYRYFCKVLAPAYYGDCGGFNVCSVSGTNGCFATLTLNGTIIAKGDSNQPNIMLQNNISGLKAIAGVTSISDYNACHWMINEYYLSVPKDKIIFNVSASKPSAFVGEDVVVFVTISNNWIYEPAGSLEVKYETLTPFGPATKTDIIPIASLPKGVSTWTFSVPTKNIANNFSVTPNLHLWFNNGQIALTNIGSSYTLQVNINNAPTINPIVYPIDLGLTAGDTFKVMINPAPLYLTDRVCTTNSDCPINYDCQTKTNMCIRNDVKNLSCYQIGCPDIEGHNYACTSAGICAETVFVTVWGTCPEGTTPSYSFDNRTVCINTVLVDKILECTTNTGCTSPCKGITGTCSANKCNYIGKCINQPPATLTLWENIALKFNIYWSKILLILRW